MAGGITEFLLKHTGLCPVSFHMPGHKGSELYRRLGYGDFLEHIMDCDITEIPGADNLFQTEGIIRETQEKYQNLYGVKKSYLLINGTSGGLIAGTLASVEPGGSLILARNCHKAVFNALTLGNIKPVYAYQEEEARYGIAGVTTADEIDRLMREHPEARAVVLPSPNYYGICSDIAGIAETVHSHDGILIVDQAHGAHLKFMKDQPAAAEDCGADIIVDSIHKTLASFTQSAVLHVNSERISLPVLEDQLQKIESTSPSYLLMASLDLNGDIMREHGTSLFTQWQENLDVFYREAEKIPGLRMLQPADLQGGSMDQTKIDLDMSALGLSGARLEQELMKRDIFCELTTGNILMCMTGIGNTQADYEKLLAALQEIAEQESRGDRMVQDVPRDAEKPKHTKLSENPAKSKIPWNKKRPLQDTAGEKETEDIRKCSGRICGTSIIPYPPGIPLICPGEVLDDEDIQYVLHLRKRGEKVIGIDEQNRITVISNRR